MEGVASDLAESNIQSSAVASTPSAISAGANASREISALADRRKNRLFVSEVGQTGGNPLRELRGRAAHELRWLRERPLSHEGQTYGEQMRLNLDSAALMVKEWHRRYWFAQWCLFLQVR